MTHDTWQRLKSDRYGMAGLIVVAIFALVAVCVWSGLLGQGWSEVSGNRFESISASHWFGTNLLGQDILQRTLFGTATAFEVGLVVTVCSTILGSILGSIFSVCDAFWSYFGEGLSVSKGSIYPLRSMWVRCRTVDS